MGIKKGFLDFGIFITAIIGASLLMFNMTFFTFSTIPKSTFIWVGVILLIFSLIISLSKAWNK